MDLAELQTFLTVASERSFSRAAVKLHRTQPAVSQAIRRLEEEVDERLFDRTSKGGRLTEAGRILKDSAVSNEDANRARQAMKDAKANLVKLRRE